MPDVAKQGPTARKAGWEAPASWGRKHPRQTEACTRLSRSSCMSRIPVPSHSPYTRSGASDRSNSPLPFPERASSPLPPLRFNTHSTPSMSTLSGSVADTRRKQSKRDEVSPVLVLTGALSCSVGQAREEEITPALGTCHHSARITRVGPCRAAGQTGLLVELTISCRQTRLKCPCRARTPRLSATSPNAVFPRNQSHLILTIRPRPSARRSSPSSPASGRSRRPSTQTVASAATSQVSRRALSRL